MSHELAITPHGHLMLVEPPGNEAKPPLSKRCVAAFAESGAHGLLHLATHGLYLSSDDVPRVAASGPLGQPMSRSLLERRFRQYLGRSRPLHRDHRPLLRHRCQPDAQR